ncbi:MAG: FAD-dependent oxidoreductase [Thermomicrobiales bacterium]
MTEALHVPVAVIGGGPAGVSAALALARHGMGVLVLEKGDGRGTAIGESLAPSANPLLHRLGLYDALLASDPLPCYGNRSAWGGDGALADRDSLREPFGHGWHLDRAAFNASLLTAAADGGALVWRGARVVSLEQDQRTWRLQVAAGSSMRLVTSDYLIDASGRAGIVARHQGVRRRVIDSLVAAVAFLESGASASCDATTLVEAVAAGWWYTALLPSGRATVAWFTDPDLLARTGAWRPAAWWRLLAETVATRERAAAHGPAPPVSIRVMPAGSGLLTRLAGEGWLAVGDAAASFDPLSSHGIGSALVGGHQAARAAASWLAGDETAHAAYTDHVVGAFAHYLWLRHAYYADEQRWPEAPFWRRRHVSGRQPMSRYEHLAHRDGRGGGVRVSAAISRH